MKQIKTVGIVAILGVLCLTGCDNAPTAAEVGQKTGAALDKAADKTVAVATNAAKTTAEAAKTAAEATKDFTGRALDKTGEGLQKAGTAVENTGEKLQK